MSAASRGTREIRIFVRDWLIFAPIIVLIALILSVITMRDLVTEELVNGALITYAIALCYAYMEDVPLSSWEKSSRAVLRVFAVIIPNVKYLISIIGLVLAAVTLLAKVEPRIQVLQFDDAFMLGVSAGLAATSLAGAVFVIIDRIRI